MGVQQVEKMRRALCPISPSVISGSPIRRPNKTQRVLFSEPNSTESNISAAMKLLDEQVTASAEDFMKKYNFDPDVGKPNPPNSKDRFKWDLMGYLTPKFDYSLDVINSKEEDANENKLSELNKIATANCDDKTTCKVALSSKRKLEEDEVQTNLSNKKQRQALITESFSITKKPQHRSLTKVPVKRHKLVESVSPASVNSSTTQEPKISEETSL